MCMIWMRKDCITKYDKNKTRSWQRYEIKIGVEQTKDNVGLYLYLYSLGTLVQGTF
jgi:hypothetical protein